MRMHLVLGFFVWFFSKRNCHGTDTKRSESIRMVVGHRMKAPRAVTGKDFLLYGKDLQEAGGVSKEAALMIQ